MDEDVQPHGHDRLKNETFNNSIRIKSLSSPESAGSAPPVGLARQSYVQSGRNARVKVNFSF